MVVLSEKDARFEYINILIVAPSPGPGTQQSTHASSVFQTK